MHTIRMRRRSAGLREVDLEWGGDGPALAGIRDCGVHLRTGEIEGAIAKSSPPGAARPCLGTALRHSTHPHETRLNCKRHRSASEPTRQVENRTWNVARFFKILGYFRIHQ